MKTANISQFKTHISSLLRAVRGGDRVLIVDRDIPVALVTPVAEPEAPLTSRAPLGPIPFRKPGFRVKDDPLYHLLEDRSGR